ncbi:tetratricopeptide repeat protein [Parasphingorhabdus sp.]|uniref:tetratricopeptide repeat protein n=1 Tax=Parasphingorhabdus sp. TaxID=2709688 RepID=UPI00326325F3
MKKVPLFPIAGKIIVQLIAVGALAACSAGSEHPVKDARAAIAGQDYLSARIHLMTALRENSSDPETNLLFAKVMIELGDGLGAETALGKLEGQASYRERVQPLLGKALLLNGRNDEALELVVNSQELNSAQLRSIEAMALLGLERMEEAEAVLSEALKSDPGDPELNWIRGNRRLELGDLDAATRHADLALERAPDSMEALLLSGRISLAKADGKSALATFTRLREIRADNVVAEYLRGVTLNDLGDQSAAQKSFEAVLSASPTHPWATYHLAKMDFDKGKSDAAYERLLNTKADISEVPPALRLAGILDVRRGNHEQAIDKLNRYLSRSPGDAESVMTLSGALSAAGNHAEAWQAISPVADMVTAPVEVLEQAAKLASRAGQENAATYSQRAAALKKDPATNAVFQAEQAIIAQDWNRTVKIYDRLLARPHPQKVMLLNNAAMAQLNLSRGNQAVKLAEEALTLAPDDPMVKDTLGWILLQTRKDKARALQLIREAAASAPGNLEIQWHLANAFAANGQSNEAKQVVATIAPGAGGEQRVQIENLLAWL